ncbi:hypothetical protein V6Z11_A01G128700 [Gossypium hirsutum]
MHQIQRTLWIPMIVTYINTFAMNPICKILNLDTRITNQETMIQYPQSQALYPFICHLLRLLEDPDLPSLGRRLGNSQGSILSIFPDRIISCFRHFPTSKICPINFNHVSIIRLKPMCILKQTIIKLSNKDSINFITKKLHYPNSLCYEIDQGSSLKVFDCISTLILLPTFKTHQDSLFSSSLLSSSPSRPMIFKKGKM